MMKDVERYLVTIVTLATPVEAEAKALAADLGTIAYEERMKLSAGFPAIVLATADGAVAQELLAKLRARRHRALVCRASDVVQAAAMIQMRSFELDGDGLEAGAERLPWSDISVLIRARHTSHTATTEIVKQKKFSAARAVLTGGLIMRKTETRTVAAKAQDNEQVLYLFRSSGATPWLLREHATNYSALGAALSPIASRNFALVVDQIRARAPNAKFDDTLVRRTAIDDVDLFAHLIATGLAV
jgi:hypothetical protein